MKTPQVIPGQISQLLIKNPKTKSRVKWINVINAQKPEIRYLSQNFHFNLEHLQASVANVFSQRPMISSEHGYLFIILHFPIYRHGQIIAAEIEFFIGHGYLVTVHNGNIPALNNFFTKVKTDSPNFSVEALDSSIILLYELLNSLINNCYMLIDQNSLRISQAEELIFDQKQQKEAVTMILDLRRNIINLRKILQNHENILKKITEVKSSLIPQKEIKKHYESLVEHSEKIWKMLDNQKEMIEVLNSTNESLLNGQMTNVMKTLTIISVIVFPLTLFATIFTMRVDNMPIIGHPYAFWIIISGMIACGLGMLLYFERRKWL